LHEEFGEADRLTDDLCEEPMMIIAPRLDMYLLASNVGRRRSPRFDVKVPSDVVGISSKATRLGVSARLL
jgi:hypothetical protein